jgi:hypothetical protein
MSKFFSKYPKVLYNSKLATDLMSRSTILDTLLNQASLYYKYDLQDGDTPEIIAEKYYGDPELHWVIMITNNIIDNKFDFPLAYQDFVIYLDGKYASEGALIGRSGSEYTRLTLNQDPVGYVGIIDTTDLTTGITTTTQYYIDQAAYSSQYDIPNFNFTNQSFSVDNIQYNQYTKQLTIYDYELQLNESKRTIKLLNSNYLGQFTQQFQSLMQVSYG